MKSKTAERAGMLIVIQGHHGDGRTRTAMLLKSVFEAAGRRVLLIEDFNSPEAADVDGLWKYTNKRDVIVTVTLRKSGEPRGTGRLQESADFIIQPVKVR